MSLQQAKCLLNNIKNNNTYAMIGGVKPWLAGDTEPTDKTTAPNSLSEDFNDSVILKKVIPRQFSLMAKRYDWADDLVFVQWDENDPEMPNKMFYAVNDAGHVYKCLSNNNGTPSTEMPKAITPERFTTADGYIWKYIATIPEPIALQFNNSSYIPIKTVDSPDTGYEIQYASQMAAVPGTIDRIDIIQPGKKYSQQTEIVISGDGHGAKATAHIHAITGEILSVTVSPGVGYTNATLEVIDNSNLKGEGAILKAIISPTIGHGADPERELYANTVVGTINIVADEVGHITNDFDFRKLALVTNLKNVRSSSIYISPNDGLVYTNQSNTFKQYISTEKVADVLNVKTSIDGLEFTLHASNAAPYGANEAYFTENGITAEYDETLKRWLIDYGTIKTPLIYDGFTTFVEFRKNGVLVDGDILNPTVTNTYEYKFKFDNSVNYNVVSPVGLDAIDDPIYNNTILLTISDKSGDFEVGERIEFLNGGEAYVVFKGTNSINVTSPSNIINGQIKGISSAATANVTAITPRQVTVSGDSLYQIYISKRTHYNNETTKLIPVFQF